MVHVDHPLHVAALNVIVQPQLLDFRTGTYEFKLGVVLPVKSDECFCAV